MTDENAWRAMAAALPDGSSFEPGSECLCSDRLDRLNLGLEQLLFRASGSVANEQICLALWHWMKLVREEYFDISEEGEPLPPATEEGRAFAEKLRALRVACVRAGLTFECRN